MKCWLTIEYLKCRADLNFEVDFGVNGAIGTIVTKWDLILFGYWIVFIHNKFYFKNTPHMSLNLNKCGYFVNIYMVLIFNELLMTEYVTL